MKQQKFILTGYAHPSCKQYQPKINNKKRGMLLALIIFCLVTPMTNWLIPVTLKGISKLNPIWFYQ